jgi:hypothetical protein
VWLLTASLNNPQKESPSHFIRIHKFDNSTYWIGVTLLIGLPEMEMISGGEAAEEK